MFTEIKEKFNDVFADLTIETALDSGAHGWIYSGKSIRWGDVVVKIVNRPIVVRGMPNTSKRLDYEYETIQTLNNHPNIVKFRYVSLKGDVAMFVMERMNINLAQVFGDLKQPLTQEHSRCLIKQLINGLEYIHGKNIIHRDIKPSNLLLTKDLKTIKISDFGLSREPGPELTPQICTRWYRSPEILFGCTNYDFGVDIWSLACVMTEFYTLKPLFQGESDLDQICKIFTLVGTPSGQDLEFYNSLPDFKKVDFCDFNPLFYQLETIVGSEATLIRAMLSLNPNNRPKIGLVKKIYNEK